MLPTSLLLPTPSAVLLVPTALLYKCWAQRPSCGLCLKADPRFNCGWCISEHRCQLRAHCPSPKSNWMHPSQKGARCSHPRITQVSLTHHPYLPPLPCLLGTHESGLTLLPPILLCRSIRSWGPRKEAPGSPLWVRTWDWPLERWACEWLVYVATPSPLSMLALRGECGHVGTLSLSAITALTFSDP
jgi:hypothetical protein